MLILDFNSKDEVKEIANFGDYVHLNREKYNPRLDEADYKCIELEHINPNNGTLNGYIKSKEQKSIKNKFDEDSILYGKLRPYLRKYYCPDFTGVCSSEILSLKPISNKKYYFYLLQSNRFNQLASQTAGSKMPRIDWVTISNFQFPMSSKMSEIGNILSQIDNLITLTNATLLAYRTSRKTVLSIYFNHENLNTAKISFLADIKKGEQLNKDSMVANGKYKVFNGGKNYSGLTNTYNESSSIIISEGGNSCGYIQYVDSQFWLGGHCYSVKINTGIHKKYLYYNLKYNESNIQKLRVGSGLPNIQKKDLLNYQLKYHDNTIQPIIANTLSQMDNYTYKALYNCILLFLFRKVKLFLLILHILC